MSSFIRGCRILTYTVPLFYSSIAAAKAAQAPSLKEENRIEAEWVKRILQQANAFSPNADSLQKHGQSLSTTYRINANWIKILPPIGSNGGYLIKELRSAQGDSHASSRYEEVRKLTIAVNKAAKRTLLPEFLPFDQNQTIFQYRIPNRIDDCPVPESLANRSIIFFKNIKGGPLPCPTQNKWNPTEYPIKLIQQCVQTLRELQIIGNQWLETQDPIIRGRSTIHVKMCHSEDFGLKLAEKSSFFILLFFWICGFLTEVNRLWI